LGLGALIIADALTGMRNGDGKEQGTMIFRWSARSTTPAWSKCRSASACAT
jgi:hypothetical protein